MHIQNYTKKEHNILTARLLRIFLVEIAKIVQISVTCEKHNTVCDRRVPNHAGGTITWISTPNSSDYFYTSVECFGKMWYMRIYFVSCYAMLWKRLCPTGDEFKVLCVFDTIFLQTMIGRTSVHITIHMLKILYQIPLNKVCDDKLLLR